MGLEKRSTVGSSGESWSIGETLNWRFVEMIGFLVKGVAVKAMAAVKSLRSAKECFFAN
jgi:hypothetical protein